MWEECGEPGDRMIGNAGENFIEPSDRIWLHPLPAGPRSCGAPQLCCCAGAAKEDPIVTTDCDTTDRTLRGVVVDLEIRVFT